MDTQQIQDYLMWIGAVYYPTVDVYIDEAKRLGVCKRLGHLPRDIVPGKSKIFLAHDDGLTGQGFIFGYFVPSVIQYLTFSEENIPVDIYDLVEWVSDWYSEEERECGYRKEGMYAVTTEGGEFVVFDRPRRLEAFDPDRTRFRGLLKIDYADKIIHCPRSKLTTPVSRRKVDLKTITDEALISRVESGPSLARVAQEIAYETGTKKSFIVRRYKLLVGKIKIAGDPVAIKLERKIILQRLSQSRKAKRTMAEILRELNS